MVLPLTGFSRPGGNDLGAKLAFPQRERHFLVRSSCGGPPPMTWQPYKRRAPFERVLPIYLAATSTSAHRPGSPPEKTFLKFCGPPDFQRKGLNPLAAFCNTRF